VAHFSPQDFHSLFDLGTWRLIDDFDKVEREAKKASVSNMVDEAECEAKKVSVGNMVDEAVRLRNNSKAFKLSWHLATERRI
jgi:hypothetical protein